MMSTSTTTTTRQRTLVATGENVTLYLCGMFGYYKIEARRATIERGPYAQYPSAVHVAWVERGKRKPKGKTETSHPSVVMLAGFGHFDVRDETAPTDGGRITRHASFAPEWEQEFADQLAAYLKTSGATMLADLRGAR